MSDIADMATEIEGEHLARAIAAARVPVPAGVPGECDQCGEDVPRLIEGPKGWLCAPCRDGRTRAAPIARGAALFAAVEPAISETTDQEDRVMADSRQVSFVARGETLRAIETRMAEGGAAMGRVALDLVEAALAAPTAVPAPAPAPAPAPLEGAPEWVSAWLATGRALGDFITDLLADSKGEAVTALEGQVRDATARAEAAEARLAQLRAVLS